MLWGRIRVKEFRGPIDSGWTKRNAVLKTEEPGAALPVESPFFPHRHKQFQEGSNLSQRKVPSIWFLLYTVC